MRYLTLLLFLVPSMASASDYCFICKPAVAAPRVYQKAIVRKPKVINRIVSIQTPEEPKIDQEGIIAEARALEMALSAIPGINRDLEGPRWRQHRFSSNMQEYRAPAALRQQSVAIRQVTKTYVGVADISFRIKANGHVDFQVDAEKQNQQQSAGY